MSKSNKIKKYVKKINEHQYFARLAKNPDGPSIVERDNFQTQESAMNWLDEQLEIIQPSYENMTFFKLSQIIKENPQNNKAIEALKYNLGNLKDEMLFTLVAKEGVPEKKAFKQVNQLCGKTWSESLEKAKNQTLDALISLEQEKTQERLSRMLKYTTNSLHKGSEEALEVLRLINLVPGKKIVTTNIDEESQIFDIDEKGVVGYAPEHQSHLLKIIDEGFKQPNTFVIRQFIPNSHEQVVLTNGKKVSIPWKAIYAFILHGDEIICVDEEEVEYSFTHDTRGNPIEKEEMVIYKNFKEIIDIEQ